VRGVAQLHNVVYVVCYKSSIIHMYTADTLSPLGEGVHVKGMKDPIDIVACHHDRQLYVADWDFSIWRVSVEDKSYVKWLTTDKFSVDSLSLTSRRLLLTSFLSRRLRQYSTTDKQLLCVVLLPANVKGVFHGVETTHGTFVVSYYGMAQDARQYAVSQLFRLCHVSNTASLIN